MSPNLRTAVVQHLNEVADKEPSSSIPKAAIEAEVDFFLTALAPEEYLSLSTASDVANLVTTLYSIRPIARMSSADGDAETLHIVLDLPAPRTTLFVFADAEPVRSTTFAQLEALAMDDPKSTHTPAIVSFRSKAPLFSGGSVHVYFGQITWHPRPAKDSTEAPANPLSVLPAVAQERIAQVADKWRNPCEPAIVYHAAGSTEGVHSDEVAFAFDTDATQLYLQHIVAMFADRGGVILGLYMARLAGGCDALIVRFAHCPTLAASRRVKSRGGASDERDLANKVISEATLLRLVPFRRFVGSSFLGQSSQLLMYVHAVSVFAYYFAPPRAFELDDIASKVSSDASAVAAITKVQGKFIRSVGDDSVRATLARYPNEVRLCYEDFRARMAATVGGANDGVVRTLGEPTESLMQTLKDVARDDADLLVLKSILTFNASILRTNFYKTEKAALAFRLNPAFMAAQYPANKVPYGMYMILGSHFRGFHIRFSEVSRGGVRFIRAPTAIAHERAKRHLVEENINLAYTQNLKNKDIPEGGAKGVILARWDSGAAPRDVFMRYIDALLDLMLPQHSAGPVTASPTSPVPEIPQVSDLMPDKEELIFLGPDEGTAGFMSPAALHSKTRGYRFWKAFTTGKGVALGGIPHDVYGMTTSGVRVFVHNTIKLLGLEETETTKVQIGGPDGDLGSNEILTSKDKTIAIVDGSGVLYDPVGIDREELVRLAKARKMISNFDATKLSKDGYRVLCTDTETTLPSGFVVRNGFQFRNQFHANPSVTADILVPCGGRPGAVDIDNVKDLLPASAGGSPKYRAIVEGANLFVTEDARAVLEGAGVVVFKDASVNKGGVTSSSLEVLAALALKPDAHTSAMCVADGGAIPPLYESYVKDILAIIRRNGQDEFDALQRLYVARGGATPRPVLTNELSMKINNMNTEVTKNLPALLAANPGALEKVLTRYIPQSLVASVGMETIRANVPENYQHAIFAAYVASQYVYKHAADASEFTFFAFFNDLLHK